MKVVKIAATVAGGLVLLAAAAVLAVAWLFDPNGYKDRIASEFERRTERTLVIERDLALEYLPWLAVETGGVVVGNAAGFSARPFARVDRLTARIELWPLLAGRLRIGTIVLDGLVLNLELDAEGRGNWTLPGTAQAAERAADTTPGSSWLETLDVDGIRISGAEVNWRDLGTGREYAISDLSVTTGAYRDAEPFDVETALRIVHPATETAASITARATVEHTPGAGLVLRETGTELEVSAPGRLNAAGEVRIETIEWRTDGPLTATGTELRGSVESEALGGGPLDVAAAASRAELDPATGALRVDELTTSLGRLEARWRLSGQALFGDSGVVDGSVAIERAPLGDVLGRLSVALPDGMDARELGDFDLASRFALRLDAPALELASLEARALGAAVAGSASWNPGSGRITAALEAPEFAPSGALRALLAPHVPAGVALDAFERVALATAVDADPAARTVAFRDVRAALLGATFTGRADLTTREDGSLSARGRLTSSEIEPGAFVAAFDELVTDTVDRDELGTLSFDAGFDYDGAADRLALDPLALQVFGLSAAGRLTASALSTSPIYTGRASVARTEPRDLMRRFGQTPPATSDPAALGNASVDTRFEVTAERGEFRELVLALDDSRITGRFAVEDFANPAYRFALAIDRLDADRYLAPKADDAEAGERTAGDLELTGDALDVLDLDGRVEVGALALAGLELRRVATRIAVGGGRLELEDAGAALYGGRFDGALGVDTTGETPRMTLTGRARGLDLAPLVTALAGDAHFSGTGDFDLSLSGAGVTVTDNVRGAAGTMGFTMRDGAIEGFDLGRSLCSAYNATRELPRPPRPDVERTRYALLRGTADVEEGVATSPDLLGRTSFMDVTGRGSIDLLEQGLDYELDAKLTGPIDIPRCESMNALVGESIPLTLGGTLSEPEILPDFREILKRRVEEELRERATESVEEELRERLRDLF